MDSTTALKNQREKMVKGLELAYKKLIEFKKSKNSPIVISRDGKIIELDPKETLPTTTGTITQLKNNKVMPIY